MIKNNLKINEESTNISETKDAKIDYDLNINFDYILPAYQNISKDNLNNFLNGQDNILTKENNTYKFNFDFLFNKKSTNNKNEFIENYLNNKNNDFQSESEDIFLNQKFIDKKTKINFYNDNLKNGNFNINKINLETLFEINSKICQNQLIYKCKYCNEKFSKASAWGGHTSKKHSDKTKISEEKLINKKIRKTEIERQNYLKNYIEQ